MDAFRIRIMISPIVNKDLAGKVEILTIVDFLATISCVSLFQYQLEVFGIIVTDNCTVK